MKLTFFASGTGRRRAVDRIDELRAELERTRRERDEAKAMLQLVIAARDEATARSLTAQVQAADAIEERDAARRQAEAANIRVDQVEATLEELRGTVDHLRDNTGTQPIPVIVVDENSLPMVEHVASANSSGGLPSRLPEWARRNGYVYSRVDGFRPLPDPVRYVKPATLSEAAEKGELT